MSKPLPVNSYDKGCTREPEVEQPDISSREISAVVGVTMSHATVSTVDNERLSNIVTEMMRVSMAPVNYDLGLVECLRRYGEMLCARSNLWTAILWWLDQIGGQSVTERELVAIGKTLLRVLKSNRLCTKNQIKRRRSRDEQCSVQRRTAAPVPDGVE